MASLAMARPVFGQVLKIFLFNSFECFLEMVALNAQHQTPKTAFLYYLHMTSLLTICVRVHVARLVLRVPFNMAMASTSREDSASCLAATAYGSTQHQPGASFSFPKRAFGKTQIVYHSFQGSWFCFWSWLHYDETEGTALCFLCSKAVREEKMMAGNADAAFVS